MLPRLAKDEIERFVGNVLDISNSFALSPEQVSAFAEFTLDHNLLPKEHQAACAGEGNPYAVGTPALLLLSFMCHYLEGVTRNIMIEGASELMFRGLSEVACVRPVMTDRALKIRASLSEFKEYQDGQFLYKFSATVFDAEEPGRSFLTSSWLFVAL